MAKNTPKVVDCMYEYFDIDEGKITISFDIRTEIDAWLDELQRIKSVRIIFTNPECEFSIYKQIQIFKTHDKHGQKKEIYQGSFWKMRKTIDGRLHRVYIGKNSNLTATRLAEIAEIILSLSHR